MGQLLNWESETQLTNRVSSTHTPTTPFGFFSFSPLPCGSEMTTSGNKQNSPGLVTSPMQLSSIRGKKSRVTNSFVQLNLIFVQNKWRVYLNYIKCTHIHYISQKKKTVMLFSHRTHRFLHSLIIYGLHNSLSHELHVVKLSSLYALKNKAQDEIEVERIILNKIINRFLFHFGEEYFCTYALMKKQFVSYYPGSR